MKNFRNEISVEVSPNGNTVISSDEGLFLNDIVELVKSTDNFNGQSNPFITLGVEDVETHTSRIVEASFDRNEPNEGPGGILWLKLDPAVRQSVAEAFHKKDYEVLEKPLTKKQMKKQIADGTNSYVSGVVAVDLSDFIDNDLEGVLDLLSDRLTGSPLLSDINYEVVGHEGSTLHVRVNGDVGLIEALWQTTAQRKRC